MQDKHLFEYAVIRIMPRVEREEFLNVGVIVYCAPQDFLQTAFELNEERLRAFGCDLKTSEIEEHLRAFEQICKGGVKAGAIGKLPLGERFRWLTAPRSTVVQTSAVHTGLSSDARKTLGLLLTKLVRQGTHAQVYDLERGERCTQQLKLLCKITYLQILQEPTYHVPTLKVCDILKLLKNDGWFLVATVGSHRQFKHPTKSGRVTVAGHPSDDVHPKTVKSILTQAGLNK